MGWNGSGNFQRTNGSFFGATVWQDDQNAGYKITAARFDTHDQDIALGINNCLTKDGQNSATGDLPMGGNRHTNVGNATARTHYASLGQVQDGAFLWGGTSTGTNAITFSTTPSFTGYAAGQVFRFLAGGTPTGATTVQINGIASPKTLQRGGSALVGNEFKTGDLVEIVYDGTNFQLSNIVPAPLFIDRTNNRVGVGTTAPSNTLDVRATDTSIGVYRFIASGASPELALVKSRGATVGTNAIVSNGDQTGSIIFYGADGTNYKSSAAIIAATDGTIATDRMPGQILFYTTPDVASGNLTERMRLKSDGALLINTTSNFAPATSKVVLDAGGGAAGMGVLQTNASNTCISLQNSASSGATRYVMAFYNNTPAVVGSIAHNGTATTYATSSDHRLKEDVEPMTGATAIVKQLKPSRWKWKATGTDGQGFIAHELQAIVPDAVTGHKDELDEQGNPRYQGVDLSYLVATLTAALQELEARIVELEGA